MGKERFKWDNSKKTFKVVTEEVKGYLVWINLYALLVEYWTKEAIEVCSQNPNNDQSHRFSYQIHSTFSKIKIE